MIGQEKIVFLDVGIDDGAKPGMIFRHYLHVDPYNSEDITAKDFLIEAELKVLYVLDKFSIAIITNARGNVHYGDELVSLTDLRDYEKNQGLQTVLQDTNKPTSVDDLDQLDNSEGLGEKENHDLRQLEKWAKPAPEASLPSNDSSDDIQRIETHDHPKQVYEIGKEPAPNDGSSKPETAPTPPPSSEPTPAPVEPSVVAPAPVEAATPAPTPAPVETPAPAPDANGGVQQPPADPFATPAPPAP